MKITQPDGTIIEGEAAELAAYLEAKAPSMPKISDFLRAAGKMLDPDGPYQYTEIPMNPTCEDIDSMGEPDKTHIDVPLVCRPEDPAHVLLRRLPGEPRKGVSRHIAVTHAQRQALTVMRRNPTQEWTSVMVGEGSGLKGDDLTAIINAVGRMCRDGRGVVRGHNTVHYLLDEFGRYAIPHVFARPGYKWGSMKQAWEEGREWNDPRDSADPVESQSA